MNETVRAYYDAIVETEWGRLERHPFEFAITKHFLEEAIPSGARVLDLGGGPGRYSLWLASRGCDVTLVDLSPQNVAFAKAEAQRQNLPLNALSGDAMAIEALVQGPFDAVLLMGPLYHILGDANRRAVVESCLRLLKPGGILAASCITSHAGIIYYMHDDLSAIIGPGEEVYLQKLENDEGYEGPAFTDACFWPVTSFRPWMESLGLQTLHVAACEGVAAPVENRILEGEPAVLQRWLRLSLALCEREEFFGLAEHLLYIGNKA